MKKSIINLLLVIVILVVLFMWQCPFERITGIPCPGCMMTTAAYYLLHLDFEKAFYFNPVIYLLVVMSIPLIYTYFKNRKWFRRLLILTLAIWLGIYIYRMITIFPDYPMPYVEDNLIARILKGIK